MSITIKFPQIGDKIRLKDGSSAEIIFNDCEGSNNLLCITPMNDLIFYKINNYNSGYSIMIFSDKELDKISDYFIDGDFITLEYNLPNNILERISILEFHKYCENKLYYKRNIDRENPITAKTNNSSALRDSSKYYYRYICSDWFGINIIIRAATPEEIRFLLDSYDEDIK